MSKSAPRARHLELVSSAPSSLPRYLHRRGRTYYFKRKIPSDVAKEFPNSQGQLWKSLDTPLLERAKVMLAVEVTEFDLKLARCRNERATQIARVAPLMRLVNGTSGESSFTGSSADDVSVALSAPAQEHFDLVRSIEASLERLRVLALPTVLPGQHTPRQSVPNGEAVAVANVQAKPNSRGRILPTMLHLFEDWCLKQTRPRTVGAVRKAVLEFRELHGPLPVENINRQHARDYRDVLIERKLSDGTIENRIGFLSTLMRHGLAEMVEHLTGNPFENIVINGGQGQRAPKDRRAFEVSELNTLFASRLYT